MSNLLPSTKLSQYRAVGWGPWGATANSFAELVRNREIMASTTESNGMKAPKKQHVSTEDPSSNVTGSNKRKKTQAQPPTHLETVENQVESAVRRHKSTDKMLPLPARKKNPLNFSKPGAVMVDIIVGSQEHHFGIHKSAICHWSSYFNNAFSSKNTVEGETKIMKLPTVDPQVFGLFSNYLYTQEIEHGDDRLPELMELARLWTYAAEWRVPSLQNKAMELLIPLLEDEMVGESGYKGSLLQEFVTLAYSAAGSHHQLKRLAAVKVMMFASSCGRSVRNWIEDFPKGMPLDLAEALINHISGLPKGHRSPKFIAAAYQVSEL